MEMMPDFSADRVKMLVADTLRLFVGHGRRLSWADLAHATGVNEKTLRSYCEAGGNMMPLNTAMAVFAVLPPEGFAKIARHVGFSAAPLDVDDAATVRRMLAQSARLVAAGNEYLEDGKLTPSERASLAEQAAALLPALQFIAGATPTQ